MRFEILRTTTMRTPGAGTYITVALAYNGPISQVTECLDIEGRRRFWVRENIRIPGGFFYVNSNQRWGLKGGADLPRGTVQILELAVHADLRDSWGRIAAMVHEADGLHRPVHRNAGWTPKKALEVLSGIGNHKEYV